jgi:hypothetical protein
MRASSRSLYINIPNLSQLPFVRRITSLFEMRVEYLASFCQSNSARFEENEFTADSSDSILCHAKNSLMRCDILCQLTIFSPDTAFRLMKSGFNTSSYRYRPNRLSLTGFGYFGVESILLLSPKIFIRRPPRSDSKGDASPVCIPPHTIARLLSTEFDGEYDRASSADSSRLSCTVATALPRVEDVHPGNS